MHRTDLRPLGVLAALVAWLPAQAKPDPLAGAKRREFETWQAKWDAARARVLKELEAKLAATADPAAKSLLEIELASFEVGDVLPASLPEEARRYQNERAQALKHLHGILANVGDRKIGDAAVAEELAGQLDRVREKMELATWEDFRCQKDFAHQFKLSGFAWQGPTIVPPKARDSRLRLPSRLDGTESPAQYQLRFEVVRVDGEGPLQLIFPLPGDPAYPEMGMLVLDGDGGSTSGLASIGGKSFQDNSWTYRKPVLRKDELVDVVLTCETNRVRVEVDGAEVIDFPEMKRFTLPRELKQLSEFQSGKSVYVQIPAGSSFHIASFGFRPGADQQQQSATVSAETSGERLPEDQLPLHRVWRGKNDKGVATTAKVIARNQARRTATIELRAANGWHVRMDVDADDAAGKQFQVGNTRRLDAKVRIDGEGGNGSASSNGIHISWNWHNHRGQRDGYYEGWFKGK